MQNPENLGILSKINCLSDRCFGRTGFPDFDCTAPSRSVEQPILTTTHFITTYIKITYHFNFPVALRESGVIESP
jgi:hypothetical protein